MTELVDQAFITRAVEWPFGECGPSPLHVACPSCGAPIDQPCSTQIAGASHGSRVEAADKLKAEKLALSTADIGHSIVIGHWGSGKTATVNAMIAERSKSDG